MNNNKNVNAKKLKKSAVTWHGNIVLTKECTSTFLSLGFYDLFYFCMIIWFSLCSWRGDLLISVILTKEITVSWCPFK